MRMPADDIRKCGRATQGVRVARLDEGDRVVSAATVAGGVASAETGEIAGEWASVSRRKNILDFSSVRLDFVRPPPHSVSVCSGIRHLPQWLPGPGYGPARRALRAWLPRRRMSRTRRNRWRSSSTRWCRCKGSSRRARCISSIRWWIRTCLLPTHSPRCGPG